MIDYSFNPLNLSKFKKFSFVPSPPPYSFTIEVDSGEKLTEYQANSSCVIMCVILMNTLFYKAWLLQGEI